MAKGRMLNRTISVDERVSALSLEAIILYMMCIPHLDREGRMYAASEVIKGTIVPFIDKITIESIPSYFQEMNKTKLVSYYGDGRKRYVQFSGFKKNQKIHPHDPSSVIPSPEEVVTMSDNGVQSNDIVQDCNVISALNRRECKRREGEGEGEGEGEEKEKRNVPAAQSSTSGRVEKTQPDPFQASRNNRVKEQDQIDACLDIWNRIVPHKIKCINGTRKELLKERFKEADFFKSFEAICRKIITSDFLTGMCPSKECPSWKATFDWVIKDSETWGKIIEGNYDNSKANLYNESPMARANRRSATKGK